ncbi:MAG: hypothetical protein ACKN9V_07715, partial [Pseudomonadota bacterium]
AFLESPFLEAADFFRTLKLTEQTKISTAHINRLIGQHLCFELEAQANKLLKPILVRELGEKEALNLSPVISMRQLGTLVHTLRLNKALAELLSILDRKKEESLNWHEELSESWLWEVERDFGAAIEYLKETTETQTQLEKAA